MAAAPVGRLALSITGLPQGQVPAVRQHVAAHLAADDERPLAAVDPPGSWFWQESRSAAQAELHFDRYDAGRRKRTLVPWTAARYAYWVEAEGNVVLRDESGDSVLAVVPFSFVWQRPLAYQFPGISPDAPAVQATAASTHAFESEALEALSLELTRAVRRALQKSDDARS
jgi:hypothetical protein